jgi:hypothetical protein
MPFNNRVHRACNQAEVAVIHVNLRSLITMQHENAMQCCVGDVTFEWENPIFKGLEATNRIVTSRRSQTLPSGRNGHFTIIDNQAIWCNFQTVYV